MIHGHYTVDGFFEPICDDTDNCEDCICNCCNKDYCDDCEFFAMSRGLSDVAIGGVFADVAKELFGDDLMPGVTFEDYAGDDSSGDDSSGDDFSG